MTMDKNYDPAAIEARIALAWEQADAFKAGQGAKPNAESFSIVIPPPNVTGSLHMGHALNNTLQDILVRFERMRGKDVLWQPGTDHAGIATQMVVERKLAAETPPRIRKNMDREAFLKEVWAWKEESGGTIVNQLKRLGASCDWSRERFTMDEGGKQAVTEFFIALHKTGLVYKDKRLVNWDPKFQTAISDLEVEQREIKGNLWYFNYPLEGEVYDAENADTFITIATTRPETMFGDSAVAVHPENPKLKYLIGRKVVLPLVGRTIPIIGDEYADPEKGTGAVKITPAHDFNDYEVGKRHDLPLFNILTPDAKLNADVPEAYRGKERFDARKKVVADIEALGLLNKIEPHVNMVPHGDRSGVVIEPLLTDQWYVNVRPLADKAVAAVKTGKTRIMPQNRETEFFNWLENIEPWCISRQLWWGHQIPVWYGVDGKEFIARNEDEAYDAYAAWILEDVAVRFPSPLEGEGVRRTDEGSKNNNTPHPTSLTLSHTRTQGEKDNPDASSVEKIIALLKNQNALTRETDVLDTWFSSALWPFSTMGWPEKTPELAKYYPTSVLITGFDILFFWVARMMMAGLFTQDDVPFKDVYIHGLVRDQNNKKMSKTTGNVIDPLEVIDTYGADALRLAMAALASGGRDIKLSTQRIESYRNFATKIWNSARFAEMNGCERVEGFDPKTVTSTLNKWVLSELSHTALSVTSALETYRFNDAANAVYKFVWNTFCDWYVELSKPVLQGIDGADKNETRATTAFIIDEICKLLHPFMPFITEELWAIKSEQGAARSTFPSPLEGEGDPKDRMRGEKLKSDNPSSDFASLSHTRTQGEKENSPLATSPFVQAREGSQLLCLTQWPNYQNLDSELAKAEINWLIEAISQIRSARAEMSVPAASQIPLVIINASATVKEQATRWNDALKRLARLSDISLAEIAPPKSVQIVLESCVLALPLAGIIDMDAERARLTKEQEKQLAEIAKVDAKLSNADFVARAPTDILEENRARKLEAEQRVEKIKDALNQLG
jgi:valyl-tRNA synthetase